MSVIKQLIKDDIRLPSPPSIAIRILKAVKKGDASYSELANIISSDPSLTAKTLKVVNSSFYALREKVGSLEKALAILGLNTMKNIALSFVMANELRSNSDGGFDFNFFWKRSVTAAVAADLSANLIDKESQDAFVSGLLQDIGIAVMYFSRDDEYLKVLDEKTAGELSVEAAENIIFGFDHQTLGSEILKVWGLPENIYLPIGFHHRNTDAPGEYEKRVHIIYLSDKISSVYHGGHSSEKIEEIQNVLGNMYGITEGEIKTLIDRVASQSIEILSLFEIDPADMKPYSRIIEEAKEELGKLNLSYDQVLIKYNETKVREGNLAEQLKHSNEKLRSTALEDRLSGLYNQKYFQEILEKELGRAARFQRPFSLIMFDVDHFKKVNDSHGYRIGDIVLQKISSFVRKNVRIDDIVARYGGEEFAIIAPETNLKGAAVFGDRLRRAVEQMNILADSVTVQTTISVGAVTYLPGKGSPTKAELLDAAGAAMANAKNNGRNKLSMSKMGSE